VQLTDAGKRYFERFSEALDIIGSSVNTAPRFEMHRPVRISAVQGVVMSILLPLHEKLTREIAGLSIHYELGRALTDFSEGTDLAIRSGGGMWKGMRVAELFPARVQPIAGTVIAEQLGPNPPAERLLEFPLIHLVVDLAWRTWFERKGIAFAKRPQDHVFDDVIVALAAVRHGLGIGLSRERIDPLPDGEHVHYVADQRVTLNTGYFLVRPADRRLRLPAKRYAGGIMQSMGHGNAAIEAFIEE
jgi:DNA-binding transcriptional LysR family regulator